MRRKMAKTYIYKGIPYFSKSPEKCITNEEKCKFFLDEVNDMLEKLYPTTVDVQYSKWTTRIREIFSTVSELECGAHAALAPGPIDYFIYLDENCYLGDIPHGSSSSGDDTVHNIRIRRG